MVDEEDCKEAFKLYDKEDSGVIAKEVSNPKKFFMILGPISYFIEGRSPSRHKQRF